MLINKHWAVSDVGSIIIAKHSTRSESSKKFYDSANIYHHSNDKLFCPIVFYRTKVVSMNRWEVGTFYHYLCAILEVFETNKRKKNQSPNCYHLVRDWSMRPIFVYPYSEVPYAIWGCRNFKKTDLVKIKKLMDQIYPKKRLNTLVLHF